MTFCERLKELRTNRKTTQKTMSSVLGVTERGYQHYELGTREPSMERLSALADYFDVSIDYLVGRTDNPKRL